MAELNRRYACPMYVFAAYNAAPVDLHTVPSREEDWYARLASEPTIGGLELASGDSLHPRGIARLAGLLAPHWSSVISDVPGLMSRIARAETYGLASSDDSARRRAISDVRELHGEVCELKDALGDHAIRAVEIHSAPRTSTGWSSQAAFEDSLSEIAGWAWGETRLVVEHCDAFDGRNEPAKGFLTFAQEASAALAASRRTGTAIGQSINWGRSAIETRSALGPLAHLKQAIATETMRGLMFSGAGDATARSAAWEDAHLGFAEEEPESLLTEAELRACLRLVSADRLVLLGVKVGAPAGAATDEERLAPGIAALHRLHAVASVEGALAH